MTAKARKIFVNLAVTDLKRSVDFFKALGFEFNAQFTDDKATCMIISEEAYAMLLVKDRFKEFTRKPIVDSTKQTESIVALTAESRKEVDEIFAKALASGGKPGNDVQDLGFMYTRSFEDPDGHLWEIFYMDPAAFTQ